MKIFITIILVSISLNSFSQLPVFKSNVSIEVSKKSLVKENFSAKYEYILSYHANSYWSKGQTYFIFGYDTQNWTLIRWTFKLDEKNQITKQRKKKLKYSREQLEEFLSLMDETGFYTFKQRTLNLNRRDNGDGTAQLSSISDGGTDKFELITPHSHRISSAYAADILQEEYPTSHRKNFIECRNKFLSLLKK